MNPRICRCCGQSIPDEGNVLSRNPNVCASCSSMADGMEESNVPHCDKSASDHALTADAADQTVAAKAEDKEVQAATHPAASEA